MNFTGIREFIRDLGFPGFVALYLLMQLTPGIAEFRATQRQLLENDQQIIRIEQTIAENQRLIIQTQERIIELLGRIK